MTFTSVIPYFVIYGAQIAFPADQASIAGYLVAISQASGFVIGLALTIFVDGERTNSAITLLILIGICLLGAIITTTI